VVVLVCCGLVGWLGGGGGGVGGIVFSSNLFLDLFNCLTFIL